MARSSRYEEFRRAIRDLGIVAQGDLAVLWRSVRDARDAKEALMDLLPDLVETYSLAAGSLAADYYDALREEAGARKRFSAIVPEPGDTGTQSLVAWALDTATDGESFKSLVEGGFQKRIANGARNVVTTSSVADPSAEGWMRIGSGECDFCAMLVSRGAVYSEESVDFAPHDHCHCQAAPAFNPAQVRAVKSEYVPSARRRSEAQKETDNARVREWIANNL
ncbi:MAG TPA: hypothetical protein VF032_07755 [Thermoleophilaceae bacterium]